MTGIPQPLWLIVVPLLATGCVVAPQLPNGSPTPQPTVTVTPQPTVTTAPSPPPTRVPDGESNYQSGYQSGYDLIVKRAVNGDWCETTRGVDRNVIESLARQQFDNMSGAEKRGMVDGIVAATVDACR